MFSFRLNCDHVNANYMISHCFEKLSLIDGTPADSTQGLQGKERNQEYEVETSSAEQAESSSSVPEKDAYQVGSTDNGTSTMQKEDNSEIFPESSSSEAQGKVVSMEAVPSSASSLPSELTKPASEQVNIDLYANVVLQEQH